LDVFDLFPAEGRKTRPGATFFQAVIGNAILHDTWIIAIRTEYGMCKPAQLEQYVLVRTLWEMISLSYLP
jgi:hypothetical protein